MCIRDRSSGSYSTARLTASLAFSPRRWVPLVGSHCHLVRARAAHACGRGVEDLHPAGPAFARDVAPPPACTGCPSPCPYD
eukprot:11504341-Alexandrium_andersonii.AAC.1